MVFVLYLVIGLGAVALLWGGAWVLKIAFRIGIGWGLVCLLFPPVFLARHWEECRLPFFVNITGILVFLVGMMGLAGYTENAKVKDLARVEWEDVDPLENSAAIADPWWNENQVEEDSAESNGVFYGAESDASGEYAGDQGPVANTGLSPILKEGSALATPTPLPHWLKKWGREVQRDEYESMIGSVVKVSTSDGQSFKVVLVGVGDTGIRVRQRVGTGSIMFSLDHETVIEVRVRD